MFMFWSVISQKFTTVYDKNKAAQYTFSFALLFMTTILREHEAHGCSKFRN